jgi:hypothetical protein
MQEPQVTRPPTGRKTDSQVGLAWLVDEWGGERVLGHGGGTIGQLSFLEIAPEKGFAVCLLTNSMTGGLLWRDLGRYLFDELAGIEMPELPRAADPAPKLDLARYVGRYERVGTTSDIAVDGAELVLTATPLGPLAELGLPPQTLRLRPLDAETFVGPAGVVINFLEFDRTGKPRYLHMGRAARRVPTAGPTTKTATKAPTKKATKAPTKTATKTTRKTPSRATKRTS